jgi:hypothetical protein
MALNFRDVYKEQKQHKLCTKVASYQVVFLMAQQPLVSQGLLIFQASRLHSDTAQSVGLLWTSDKTDAETST